MTKALGSYTRKWVFEVLLQKLATLGDSIHLFKECRSRTRAAGEAVLRTAFKESVQSKWQSQALHFIDSPFILAFNPKWLHSRHLPDWPLDDFQLFPEIIKSTPFHWLPSPTPPQRMKTTNAHNDRAYHLQLMHITCIQRLFSLILQHSEHSTPHSKCQIRLQRFDRRIEILSRSYFQMISWRNQGW